MRKLRMAMLLGAAVLAGAPAARAAVTYDFVADSAFGNPNIGYGGTFHAAFTLTVSRYITADTRFQPSELDSCSVASSTRALTICDAHDLFIDLYGEGPAVAFGVATFPGLTSIYYVFQPGAFAANGTYETVRFGASQHAVLTVSGFEEPQTPGGVPEPSAWALMIAGFGLAGATLRRRRPEVA